MKKLIAFTLITIAISSNAQLEVYDPTVHLQLILDTAKDIAKYTQMINNQVQQIQTLTSQLTEFKKYEAIFGNPASTVLPMVQPLIGDLQKIETGQPLMALQTAANGNQAMMYSGGGLFSVVGTNFTTPKGKTNTRPLAPYLPISAVQNATSNYLSTATNIQSRRVALKQQIATTIKQLQTASTASDVQKLTGVLIGLSSDLNNSDYELNQASGAAVVQDVANRNDAQRQVEAQKEQQQAEFTEGVQQYGQTFRLMNAPTDFPTQSQ